MKVKTSKNDKLMYQNWDKNNMVLRSHKCQTKEDMKLLDLCTDTLQQRHEDKVFLCPFIVITITMHQFGIMINSKITSQLH